MPAKTKTRKHQTNMKSKTSYTQQYAVCALVALAIATAITRADTINVGPNNAIGASFSSVVAGDNNEVDSTNCFVSGYGNWIDVDAEDSSIASGRDSYISSEYSFIGGGTSQFLGANSAYSFIGGGAGCQITGYNSTIVGGYFNAIAATNHFIGAGLRNIIPAGTHILGVITGGFNNTNQASFASIGGGQSNLASATNATIPGGSGAVAANYGQQAYAGGSFVSAGDAQSSLYVLRGKTTSASLTELFLDGSGARMVIPSGGRWTFDILISAGTTNGNTAGYEIKGVLKNFSGTTSIVGANTTTTLANDAGAASWSVSAVADNSNSALAVKVTGDSTTIRWVATVRTSEVVY